VLLVSSQKGLEDLKPARYDVEGKQVSVSAEAFRLLDWLKGWYTREVRFETLADSMCSGGWHEYPEQRMDVPSRGVLRCS
jgi:hypothetical protein